MFTTALVVCWDEVPAKEKEDWLTCAGAALEAAGVVVVDRVGHISKEGSIACCDAEGKHDVLPLLKSDKLYIERANISVSVDEDAVGNVNRDESEGRKDA